MPVTISIIRRRFPRRVVCRYHQRGGVHLFKHTIALVAPLSLPTYNTPATLRCTDIGVGFFRRGENLDANETRFSGIRSFQENMADQSPPERYKADMPQIPGVTTPAARPNPLNNPAIRVAGGLLAVLIVMFFGARWLLRPQHNDLPVAEPPPKIEVPAPAPDPAAAMPHTSEQRPDIATIAEMSAPWSSKQFFMPSPITGTDVPAMLIRLPSSSASQDSGYWAFSLKAPYGDCTLEYVSDLARLKSDYDYKAARHPMVGNPCTRTVFDPTKLFNLPGNVWVRGLIVQGSDLRPPLGIEVKVQGKAIQAVRME